MDEGTYNLIKMRKLLIRSITCSMWILTDAIFCISTSSVSESWNFLFKNEEFLILLLEMLGCFGCQSHDRPSLNPLVAVGPLFHYSE